jgi:hypothetical protein
MHLSLALNLLHFFPDLSALYALRHTPNFYEIHPRNSLVKQFVKNGLVIYVKQGYLGFYGYIG